MHREETKTERKCLWVFWSTLFNYFHLGTLPLRSPPLAIYTSSGEERDLMFPEHLLCDECYWIFTIPRGRHHYTCFAEAETQRLSTLDQSHTTQKGQSQDSNPDLSNSATSRRHDVTLPWSRRTSHFFLNHTLYLYTSPLSKSQPRFHKYYFCGHAHWYNKYLLNSFSVPCTIQTPSLQPRATCLDPRSRRAQLFRGTQTRTQTSKSGKVTRARAVGRE